MTEPVRVFWVSLHEPEILAAGYADQEMTREWFEGGLWPVPLPTFEHHIGLPEGPEGAVVVFCGRWHVSDLAALSDALSGLSWAVVVVTGDEQTELAWWELRDERRRLWVQTPDFSKGVPDVALPNGYWTGTRTTLRGLADEPRRLSWFFVGQLNNVRREECHRVLAGWRGDGGRLTVTSGFARGIPRAEFLAELAQTKVAPAPSGSFTPDSFRVYEALEAGAVPVVDTGTPDACEDYWGRLFGEQPPFPVLTRWEEFRSVVASITADWPGSANQVGAGWLAYKRRLAWDMADQLATVSGETPATDVDQRITVLLPTSPIASHPDLAVIAETIQSIRDRLPRSEILIMVDGVNPEQADRAGDYAEYTRRLIRSCTHEWAGVLPIVHDTHLHQAEMTRQALPLVRTPLVLFVEHDTPLVGEIDFAALELAIGSGYAHTIRLHHEASILEPHRNLMLDRKPVQVEGAPLLRTVQWSQRPHLSRTDHYRWMISEHFGAGDRIMIEDVMHGVVSEAWNVDRMVGWHRHRLCMYAPDGDMKRSTHTDGRAGAPKFEELYVHTRPGDPSERRIPRVGVFGARGDRRGLATQTTGFARWLNPVKVFGIDMGPLSPYPCDWGDYDQKRLTVSRLDEINAAMVGDWLDGLDVVIGAETFYVEWFTSLAARHDVRTVLQPNYEFLSHVLAWSPRPDKLIAPTTWHLEDIPGAEYLPPGVDRLRLPFRQRTQAVTFLHVVGHAAMVDRAGTKPMWEALSMVTQPIRMVVRSQRGMSIPRRFGPHIELEVVDADLADYADLYADADVLVLPRRYGGLCQPQWEALSAGMPVLMTDTAPQNTILPPGMLIPTSTGRQFTSLMGPMDLHDANPRALATMIDRLAADPESVAVLSKQADELAETVSWANLESRYSDLFDRLVNP